MNASNIRVALRADASRRIGLGHVKRCIALAAALRSTGADVRLVTRQLGLESGQIDAADPAERLLLPPPVSGSMHTDRVPHAAWAEVGWELDAMQTIEALQQWRPDWVVVDHYAFDERWHDRVCQGLKTRLAAIDDLADRDISAEVLVDPNLSDDHRKKYAGHLPKEAALLGGPRFALLGPAYASGSPLVIGPTVRSIGIFMGGVDAGNLSSLALRACREHAEFRGRIEIATTSSYPHAADLRALARRWMDTEVSCDLPHLAAFFARHDLQIGAGGGAAWERCCIGAPTLAVAAALNQDAVLPALSRLGAVQMVRGPDLPDEREMGRAIRSLIADPSRRRELSERSRALVDGLGAKRVALRLAAASFSIRPATLSDSETMYAWRNAAATRSVSTNPNEIRWEDHQCWVRASLASPERWLFIGRVGSTDVGVIRFDRRASDRFEVSLYLDPAIHGLGLGRALLLAGERCMLDQTSAVGGFVATVLPENRSSVRLFASCGYELRRGLWEKNVDARCRDGVN